MKMLVKTTVALLVAIALSACDGAVAPAKPTLLEVTGHLDRGECHRYPPSGLPVCATAGDPPAYTFHPPAGPQYYVESQVRFTVPYPTSIELAIDGTPLKKVEAAVGNFEYSGLIEKAENPATWRVKIRTPQHVPVWSYPGNPVKFTLSIVNVAGAQRSDPLEIVYFRPDPDPGPGIPPTGMSYSPESPSAPAGSPGPCPGGAAEQTHSFCFSKSGFSSRTIGIKACSSQQALDLLKGQYGDWSSTPGSCGP